MDDAKMAVLEERLGNVIENQKNYATEAREWRAQFCSKLNVLIAQDATRPCAVHETKLKSIGAVWGFIRWILGIGIPALVTLAVAWGALNKTVAYQERAIAKLEESFGYRGGKAMSEDGRLAAGANKAFRV